MTSSPDLKTRYLVSVLINSISSGSRKFAREFPTLIILGSSDEPKVAVLFSHSNSLHQFMMNLELYKDEKELQAYNFAEQKERKWRSSLFGQFATNVVAVLYK